MPGKSHDSTFKHAQAFISSIGHYFKRIRGGEVEVRNRLMEMLDSIAHNVLMGEGSENERMREFYFGLAHETARKTTELFLTLLRLKELSPEVHRFYMANLQMITNALQSRTR